MTLIGEIERSQGASTVVSQAQGVLRFITAGSVDDGKSTLIGRLLHDSQALASDQLEAIARSSRQRGQSEPDLSLLTDGLEAEREQGITIDVAYRYFTTPRRKFIIADAPGHVQYTRNMVTAASSADAAVILVDARKGLLEQGRRHLYLAHLLRVRHVVVAINKMDLVGYEYSVFRDVRQAFADFAAGLSFESLEFVPISALRGDMVVHAGEGIDWYRGPTLLELLESMNGQQHSMAAPLRFPVQLVSRGAQQAGNPARRYLGRVESGQLHRGQHLLLQPSAQTATVLSIQTFDGERESASAGDAIAVVLHEERDVSRGELLVQEDSPATVSRSLQAELCWFGPHNYDVRARLLIKHTTRLTSARITDIIERVNIHSLQRESAQEAIKPNDIVRVSLSLKQPLAIDLYANNRCTGAFILIDEATNHTVAAGMVVGLQ